MGIARNQFENILAGIFRAGNTIELFKEVPDEFTEQGGVLMSGTSYEPYTIRSGDFSVDGGEVTSVSNMMLFLCEADGGLGTAKGFGVFNGSTMLYFGEFNPHMPVGYNSVPTIKKYNAAKGEGIHITMTSTNVTTS